LRGGVIKKGREEKTGSEEAEEKKICVGKNEALSWPNSLLLPLSQNRHAGSFIKTQLPFPPPHPATSTTKMDAADFPENQ
jgi:hypothetical protein